MRTGRETVEYPFGTIKMRAKGLDVVDISRGLGHGSPVITLRIYAHLFRKVDSAAAAAIESLFRKPGEWCSEHFGANRGPISGLFQWSDLLSC